MHCPNAQLRLVVVTSGSKGNCSIVHDLATGDSVLVDCGTPWKNVNAAMARAGIPMRGVRAVLLTHDHSDHTRCLGVCLRGLQKKGASPSVLALDPVLALSKDVRDLDFGAEVGAFCTGESFGLGSLGVLAFPTSHDAAASCGFRFTCLQDGRSIGFMTDTGYVPGEAIEGLRGVNVLAVEANHDVRMLEDGPYPAYLKARILSERGHLSNEQAADVVAKLAWSGLETVVGMHLSEHNNLPDKARAALREGLVRAGSQADVKIASQVRPVVA